MDWVFIGEPTRSPTVSDNQSLCLLYVHTSSGIIVPKIVPLLTSWGGFSPSGDTVDQFFDMCSWQIGFYELENLKMITQCDLFQPQIGMLGIRGNMGKTTLWKATCNHFLGSGGIAIIDLPLNAKSMEKQKYLEWVTTFWSLPDYLIVRFVICLGRFKDLNLILAFGGPPSVEYQLVSSALCNVKISLMISGACLIWTNRIIALHWRFGDLEILLGLHKLPSKGIQIKEQLRFIRN